MKKFIACLFTVFSWFVGITQSPQSWTAAEIYQAIKKLNVLGTVLYVAAHPDDENTRLIAWLSQERLFRTGYLSMTRGDGGQNLIGNEQGIELGLIRTQELLAARRIDGGEQFFTRAFDFGFSKSPDETFPKWDKEKILSDVVWIIRKFQPDVVITRFPTTGEGGHGHHTASAILANEAFEAAANPSRFPEQLKYVQPWQVKRVLWNTFNFGGTNTQREDQFKTDVGGFNPLLGKSYGEIAAESRSQHKSQGFGVPAGRGQALEYFITTQGASPVTDLMDGVDLSWKRVQGGEAIAPLADQIAARFDFLHPEKSVPGLIELYRALKSLPSGYWRNKKLEETKELIVQCCGLWVDIFTQEPYAVQTDSIRFQIQLNNRGGVNLALKKIVTDGFDSVMNQPLPPNRNINFTKTLYVDSGKPLTQFYWLINKMEKGYFQVTDPTLIGMPDNEPAYRVTFLINIEGTDLEFTRPVKYKYTDPVKGELYQPLVVVPPVVISPTENLKIVLTENEKKEGTLLLKGMKKNFSGKLTARAGSQVLAVDQFAFSNPDFFINTRNQAQEIKYNVVPGKTITETQIAVKNNETEFAGKDLLEINYDHIPHIRYFQDAVVSFRYVNVKTYGKKIGYIVGAGDKVPEALEQMGYTVTLLGSKELSRVNLNQFDAILTGVRAYNTNDWLDNYYDRLMKYVEQGGNLIVQYNTNNFLGGVTARMGPYPFSINRNRITDENAEVTFLNSEHPVFNFPNKITADDFSGWVQERSIYHASDTTGKFEKLISMHDPGEKPDDGSLLVAQYGKGYFTYTGLVFFRQLPAGVPGAYRLLANLIALNRKKSF